MLAMTCNFYAVLGSVLKRQEPPFKSFPRLRGPVIEVISFPTLAMLAMTRVCWCSQCAII